MKLLVKLLVLGSALAALVFTPALAQKSRRSGDAQVRRAVTPPPPPAVYVGGQYIGTDPDPRVRLELLRTGGRGGRGGP